MRRMILTMLLLLVWGAVAPAGAQTYPTRPVKIIVPIAPGGPVDTVARALAQSLSERLKQPFVVENQAAAGGTVGIVAAAGAPPDGYTLVIALGSMLSINPLLTKKKPFDPLVDLQPLSMLTKSSQTLVVHPSMAARSLQDLIQEARREPLMYATSGNGSPSHVAIEYLRLLADFPATPIPYRGLAPLTTDLLSGQVKVGFLATSGVAEYIRNGQMRALAISSGKRSTLMPDIPTIAESGFPVFEFDSVMVMLGPAGLPPAIAELLEREVRAAVVAPDFRRTFEARDTVSIGNSSTETRAWLAAESARWSKVVDAANLRID